MPNYSEHGDKMLSYLTEVLMETARALEELEQADRDLRQTALDPPPNEIELVRELASGMEPVRSAKVRIRRAYEAAQLAERIRKEHSPKAAAAQEREARREEE